MRVILTAFGTTGDNAPFIALADALRAQGAEPLLLLNPLYESAVKARGLPFVPIGERWAHDEVEDIPKYLHPRTGGIAIWNDFYLPNVARTFAAVSRAIAEHRADMVVGHWLCFGAHFAARKAGVRRAIVTLAPCWWYSRQDPSIYTDVDAPRWLRRAMIGLPRFLVNRFIGGSMRGVCGELGVPFRRDEYFAMFGEADLNLGMWPEAFRPAAADDPPSAVLCGFPFDDSGPARLADDLERFLAAGSPPLTVGLGSSVRPLGGDVYREIGRACAELGCRAVLVGASPADAEGLSGVLAIPSAPFRLLFPRSRAIVHHGGIGTLAEALRSGAPAAVIPFANDQHDNARRARELGVSLVGKRGAVRGKKLRQLLERLLGDEALRTKAAALGEKLRGEPSGAEVAARRIVAG
jgi:rhamnosyltransferase subunit B